MSGMCGCGRRIQGNNDLCSTCREDEDQDKGDWGQGKQLLEHRAEFAEANRKRLDMHMARINGTETPDLEFEWMCHGCGESYPTSFPTRCPKCNGRAFEKIVKVEVDDEKAIHSADD